MSFRFFRHALQVALACALAAPGLAALISLKDGATVQGEVLREFPDRIIVDLGFDVLSIPRSQIVNISTEPAIAGDSAIRATEDLYSTAKLPAQNVKALVEQFGEGVVLVSTPSALGSGFFVHEDGYLITNFHVIEGELKLSVTIFRKEGNEFKRQKIEDVEIIATNSHHDIALLKVNLPAGQKPVVTYLAEDTPVRDGDAVFAIGNPLGLERSVSQGIVSRRNRAEEGRAYIQTTTEINPGNSGGPLFNMRGEVVGMNTWKITIGEGLGFALPIRYVIDFLKNREAFVYNSESSEAGFRYQQPPARRNKEHPPFLKK